MKVTAEDIIEVMMDRDISQNEAEKLLGVAEEPELRAEEDSRSSSGYANRRRRWIEALDRQCALSERNDAEYMAACKEQERLWREYKAEGSHTDKISRP